MVHSTGFVSPTTSALCCLITHAHWYAYIMSESTQLVLVQRCIQTPGHARDHFCFMLEEEESLLSAGGSVRNPLSPSLNGSKVAPPSLSKDEDDEDGGAMEDSDTTVVSAKGSPMLPLPSKAIFAGEADDEPEPGGTARRPADACTRKST